MSHRSNLVYGVLFTLLCSTAVYSQNPLGGAKIVRVSDGATSRCINRSTDTLTISVNRIIIAKKKNLFKTDTQAGIQVSTTVTGSNSKTGEADQAAISRVYVVDVKDYNKGQISLPLEGNVINEFSLTNGDFRYNGMQVSASLLRKKGDTPFGAVVRELAAITSSTSFPTTPFAPGFKLFSEFATRLLGDDNNDLNKIEERIPTSTINLIFSPKGDCAGSIAETTGTFAVVFSSGDTADPGYVDIGQETAYCFQTQTTPSFAILVGKKPGTGQCVADRPIANDYLMFFKNAFSMSPHAGNVMSERVPPSWSPNTNADVGEYMKGVSELSATDFRLRKEMMTSETTAENKMGQVSRGASAPISNNWLKFLAADYVDALKRCWASGMPSEKCSVPEPPSLRKSPARKAKRR